MSYAVFAFDQYYPNGGLTDLIGRDVETIEEARNIARRPRFQNNSGWDFWQIVDMQQWQVVEIGGILGELHREELMRPIAKADWLP